MNNNQDFTCGSIPKKLVRFLIPILGALILQAMYGAVDLLIVGRFGTVSGISGVSTGSSIMNLVTFVTCALTTGVTVLMGQHLGEGHPERLSRLIGNSSFFYFVLSLIVTTVLLIFAKPIAIMMQAPPEALDLTVLYIRICGGGFIFIVFYNYISAIFRGLGDSNMPLLFVAIACVCNILGDYVLVAILHMNVAGAAIATVGAQAVSVILSLIIVMKKENRVEKIETSEQTLSKPRAKKEKRSQNIPSGFSASGFLANFKWGPDIGAFVKIGFPLALQETLTNLTFLALLAFINRLGLDASSGYGVAQKIQYFVLLIPTSLIQSMASVVAQNVGAKEYHRAKSFMKWGMAIGAGVGVFVGLGIFFFGDVISSLFTTDPAVIARSFEFLRGFSPEAVVTCILFSFMGYFNGHGRSLFVMLQGLAQSCLVRLPMSYIMSIQPNASLTYIGLAAPTATVFGIILCFIYYRRMNSKENKKTQI